MDIGNLFHKKLKGSITVEAAFSFTIMVFVLFLLLGPLLIIKTTSDVLLYMNEASKNRCNYELVKYAANDTNVYNKISNFVDSIDILKDNVGMIENILNYATMLGDFSNNYNEESSEYKNLNYIYDINTEVYDDDTGVVKYDFGFNFNLPYNILHIHGVDTRLVINRRAFIGADGNRFEGSDSGDYVYIANNYNNSNIYHTFIDCTYLKKVTHSFDYDELDNERNENSEKYTKCDYCFKGIRLESDTVCHVTKYGDKFHYRSNCPLMTAYITKIKLVDAENEGLTICSRCERRGGGN